MERQEILLKEYEVGHNQIISVGSAIWQATSIFLSINGVVLAYFFTKKTNDPIDNLLLTTIVGVIFIIILVFWKRWMARETALQQIMYERMREIEDELGMWKNQYVHIVDQLVLGKTKLSQIEGLALERRIKIEQLYLTHSSSRRGGHTTLKGIAVLLMVGWGVLILREWINVCLPEFHTWLLHMLN